MQAEMRIKTRRFGGLLRWFFIVLMGSTILIQAAPASTNAASLNSINDLTTKTRIYNEYMMLDANKCGWKGGPGASDIAAPSWFGGDADVGLIVETDDGTIQCDRSGWLSEILRFATGSTNYQDIYNSVGNNPASSQSSTLSAYLQKYLFAGNGNGDNTSNGGLSNTDIGAMQYQSLMYSFTSSNGCKAQNKGLTPEESQGTGETTVTIQYVGADGKAGPANYTYDNGDMGKTVPVGYSVTPKGTYTCQVIANKLKETWWAQAAAAWYAANPSARTVATGSLTNASNRKTCESINGLTLAWLVCPIIELIDNIIHGLDTAIQKLLILDKSQYDNPQIRQVWGTMRNIALALIVPLMILMVIGTAMDFGPFDAYTVKKMFPRLAFAVLAIVLSYPFGVFMIELANAASAGMLGLITAAFANETTDSNTITLSSLLTGSDGAEIFGALAAGGGVAWMVGALPFGILGSLAMVTAVGLLIGFVVLTLVQLFIIFGLVLMPIRWFLWALGNTTGIGDKVDKFLWGGWLGALAFGFVFNTILGLGRGFASVVAQDNATTNWGGNLLQPAFVVILYIGPYYLIKQIAAASGAGIAMISGAVNDRGKGFFDSQRKYRAGKRQQGWDKFKRGEHGPAFNRKFGEGLGTFLESDKKGSLLRPGARGRANRIAALAQQRKLNELRYGQTERAKATKDNDGQLRAQTYTSEADARRGLAADWHMSAPDIEAALADARMNGGFSQQRANYAARALAATGTGYGNIELPNGDRITALEQLHRTVARVAQSQGEASDLFGEINAVTKNVGRHDLAAGFSEHMRIFNNAGGVGGYTMGHRFTREADEEAGYVQAFKDIDGVTYMRDKKIGVENMSRAVRSTFARTEGLAHGGDLAARAELAQLAGHIGKVEQSFGYASSTNSETAGTELTQPTSGDNTLRRVAGPNGTDVWVADGGRLRVAQESSRTATQVNEITGQVENILRSTGPSGGGGGGGFVTDPNTGRPVPFDNPERSNPVRPAPAGAESAGQAYDRNKPQSMANPYDPNRAA